ncbi:HD domain-containing protein [Tepidibacter sp. Z1-5]|uniref:HD domain-containing protein n=1 Tax=Tepidibacter sp. Z1-5 TaxID=3134138 RepID=UPI004040774D
MYDGIYKDLLFAGAILHDIGKLRELNANDIALVDDYTKEGNLLGHMIQGIKIINKACEQLSVPEEICLMLEHIIASHHGKKNMEQKI